MKDQNEIRSPLTRNRQERITINPETANRVDHWIDEVRVVFPAVKVSRSNLVDWLITARPEKLTSKEVYSIKETFFDEVAFTEWALRMLKDARSRGETLSLASILDGRPITGTEQKKGKRSRKSASINLSKEKTNAEVRSEGIVGTTPNPTGIIGTPPSVT